MASATTSRINITAVDQTKAAFSSVSSGLKGITDSLFSMQGAIAAAIGIGGFGALIKSSFDTIDALAKTSDKLGLTTEALAGLRFAAEQGGSSVSALDNSLQTMTRRVSEAAQGTGAATKALDELGLSAASLTRQSPDQQIRIIADSMQGLTTQSDRVRVAFDLFGRQGVELLNVLQDGAAGLDDMQTEAEALGIAISRVDAAKIEAANDAFNRAKQAIQGVANTIAVALAPWLEAIVDWFTDSGVKSIDWGKEVAGSIKAVGTGVAWLGEAFNALKGVWLLLSIAFAEVADFIISGIKDISAPLFFLLSKIPGATGESFKKASAGIEAIARESTARIQELQTELLHVPNVGETMEEWELFFETIEESANEHAERMAEQVAEAQEAAREANQAHNEAIEAQNKDSDTKKEKQEKDSCGRRTKIAKTCAEQAKAINKAAGSDILGDMTAAGNAMFSQNKAVSTGLAIVNTAAGVTQALKLPFPANLAAAAKVLAVGLGQIATIKGASASGGSSGSSSISGGGGSVPAAPPQQDIGGSQGVTGGGGASQVQIHLGGSSYSREDIRDLIDQINEEIGDGGQLVAI